MAFKAGVARIAWRRHGRRFGKIFRFLPTNVNAPIGRNLACIQIARCDIALMILTVRRSALRRLHVILLGFRRPNVPNHGRPKPARIAMQALSRGRITRSECSNDGNCEASHFLHFLKEPAYRHAHHNVLNAAVNAWWANSSRLAVSVWGLTTHQGELCHPRQRPGQRCGPTAETSDRPAGRRVPRRRWRSVCLRVSAFECLPSSVCLRVSGLRWSYYVRFTPDCVAKPGCFLQLVRI